MNVEKTIFISYRRTSYYAALAVFQNLQSRGFDVFFDYTSIDSGAFDQIILNQIRARAHFLLVLHANTLRRCNEPGDWVRREIEAAIDEKRNIVPITFPDFSWSADHAKPYLNGKLATLGNYNDLKVPEGYFDEAMDRLVNRYLNKPLDLIIHPTPRAEVAAVQQRIAEASAAPPVTEKQLTAQEFLSRGNEHYDNKNYDGAIADYNEALRLDPKYAMAYNNRGLVRKGKEDIDGAIADYNEALRLDPKNVLAYCNRGVVRKGKGDIDGAIADYNEALRLDPKFAAAYISRGNAYKAKGDVDGAVADYNEALRLDPKFAAAYVNRGNARQAKGDVDRAIADYNEAIRLDSKDARTYNNRGNARRAAGDVNGAIADYNEAIRLDSKYANAYHGRSRARGELGDISGADADLAEARRLDYKL